MREVDVAVVGGGPAGLAAATAAATAGARTLLLDEQSELGGQLRYRQVEIADAGGKRQSAAALRSTLIAGAREAGAQLTAGATVWGAFAGNVLGVVAEGASWQVQANAVVFATGSHDRPLPFAGGSLPGVMTARAMHILLNVHRVLPGERFVVVGSGGDAEEVTADLRAAAAAVEIANPSAALAAGGERGVAWASIDGRRVDVDGIVIAVGKLPDLQLPLMMECACGRDRAARCYLPVRDESLQSNVPGVFVAGDAAGIDEVAVALLEGTLAGFAAAGNTVGADAARARLAQLRPGRLKTVEAFGHPHLSWQGMVTA